MLKTNTCHYCLHETDDAGDEPHNPGCPHHQTEPAPLPSQAVESALAELQAGPTGPRHREG